MIPTLDRDLDLVDLTTYRIIWNAISPLGPSLLKSIHQPVVRMFLILVLIYNYTTTYGEHHASTSLRVESLSQAPWCAITSFGPLGDLNYIFLRLQRHTFPPLAPKSPITPSSSRIT
jgi:hypothetical protein